MTKNKNENFIEEFEDFLKHKNKDDSALEIQIRMAVQILAVCREYIFIHYKDAVFGGYQKNLCELIDEFLEKNK